MEHVNGAESADQTDHERADTGTYTVYSELYDDNFPTAAIAGKQHNYSTTVTDAKVMQAVQSAYAAVAQAYINKLAVKAHLENVIASLSVPTS